MIFRNKYRVVRDTYSGYEAQVKRWWFPFWMQIGLNTRSSIEKSEEVCKRHHNGGVVKYVDL